ncbi:MAG TPA: hypothetical protein VK658_26615 [Chryseolinea sp.]|nr:hypothetical protein [Chryseolinea sp.]
MNNRDHENWILNELNDLGFPKTHEQELIANLRADPDKFQLNGKVNFPNYGKEKQMGYAIFFKKYEHHDAYHPYMYHARLEKQQRSQMFRITDGSGFTVRDAFNLLHGRAVNKTVRDHRDGKMRPIWFRLDLAIKDVNGNHRINSVSVPGHELVIARQLEQQGVAEMKDPLKRINVILSLYQGNAEPVTRHVQGKAETVYALVDPMQKTVKLVKPKQLIRNNNSKSKNVKIMNKENIEFLKQRLFYLGFGENLHVDMDKKIRENADKFTLSMKGEFGQGDQKKYVDYKVDFSRSKQEGSDMYFVNNYTAKLLNEKPELERSQKFFLNKGNGVTAKEAFNLLEGRAVHKNNLTNKFGQEYSAWLQVDFGKKDKYDNHPVQQYHEAWKYDLEKGLKPHPIKELQNETQKADLIKDLKKGNLQPVTFLTQDKEVRMLIEANPKERNINVYDENMKKQFQGIKVASPETKEAKEQSTQNSMNNTPDSKGADKKEEEKSGKAKSEKVEKQLAPPEKTRKRKGMSV